MNRIGVLTFPGQCVVIANHITHWRKDKTGSVEVILSCGNSVHLKNVTVDEFLTRYLQVMQVNDVNKL